MIFTSVTGHIKNQIFKKKAIGIRAPQIEKLDLEIMDDKKNILKTLHQLASQADWLILWTDCDREGEAIARYVRQCCKVLYY